MAGPAAELHARLPADPPTRQLWVLEVTRPALVLGSTQPDSDVDHAAAAHLGVEVVRRRSGGGAVLLDPGEVLWVDAVVPRGDPLWDDDVGRAAHWFGELWADALAAVGVPGATVHRGPLVRGALGAVVCFGGLGPGEVTVAGRKVVGISQRRTRTAARFQASVPLAWRPGVHAALLAPGVVRALGGDAGRAASGAVGPRSVEAAVATLEVGEVGPGRRTALVDALLDGLAAQG